jgi:hypothetical protein
MRCNPPPPFFKILIAFFCGDWGKGEKDCQHSEQKSGKDFKTRGGSEI